MTRYTIGKPFEYHGEEIVAVPDSSNGKGCKECYFLTRPCIHMRCAGRGSDRIDTKQVFFVTMDQYLLLRVKGQA